MDLTNPKHRAWYHNSLSGRVKMAKGSIEGIISSPTVSPEAQSTAASISHQCDALLSALKTRID